MSIDIIDILVLAYFIGAFGANAHKPFPGVLKAFIMVVFWPFFIGKTL